MARAVAAGPGRLLHALLGLVLVVVVLVMAGGAMLAWRLAQGPLDVTFLIRAVERLRAQDAGPGSALGGVVLDGASIAWNGFNDGADSGLELRLTGLHTAGAGVSIARADVTLAALPLLRGATLPRQVVLDGVVLRAVRSRSGAIRLDVGGGEAPDADGGIHDMLAELHRPAESNADPNLAELQRLVVEKAHVSLVDEGSGATVGGDVTDLHLQRQETGGITGSATGRVVLGDAALALQLSAELRRDGGTHWAASLYPVSTRPISAEALSRLDPALAGIGALDATVQAQGTLEMSPALRPERADVQLSLGAGTLSVPRSAPVAFDGASARAAVTWADGEWQPGTVRLDPAHIVLVGASGRRSVVRLSADGAQQDGHWIVRSSLGLDAADFADLPSLWPVAWGGHVRPWLTENVTAGLAHDGSFSATLDVPLADPTRLQLTQAGGTLQADSVVIHWLRPVPPIERAQATLTVAGPDELVIAVSRAQQGPIALANGVLRFTGLSQKDQDMALTAGVQGRVPDLVKLLREPRLHLLDAHPVPITGSAGKFAGTLTVSMPLVHRLTFDQVSIGAKGKLSGLALHGIVSGRNLDGGNVSFDVTQDGLSASGTAVVAGVPGRAEIDMDFRAGAATDVTERVRFVGRVGTAALAAQGIDATGLLTGSALVDIGYREQRDRQAEVTVQADLTGAGVSVAGWRKPVGAAAEASATLSMRRGRITDVPHLAATGPGLAITAHADMDGGSPATLYLQQVVVGPTRLSGEVMFPAEPAQPLRIRVEGPVLDLAEQVKALSGGSGGGNKGGGGRAWVVDARIGRVILGDRRGLTEVAVHAEYGDGRLQSLQASTGGAEQLRASVTPVPNGRRVEVRAADTGAVLRALDLTGTIGGGTLAVDASYDDRTPDSPLTGRLQLGGFSVHDEVVLGKLLQAVTVYGIIDALRGKGVYFAEAQVPFSLVRNLLRIGPSRMSSASLGITAEGWVDFGRKTLALSGTVVPAYLVNAALGHLPLVGRLFSAEKGGGLFAANFSVSGPSQNPGVRINPLSLLTPGILRRLFD